MAPSRMLVLQDHEWLPVWAVAMLKKGNWQEREFVSDACHDRTGEPVEEMIAEERESSNAQIRTMLNEER